MNVPPHLVFAKERALEHLDSKTLSDRVVRQGKIENFLRDKPGNMVAIGVGLAVAGLCALTGFVSGPLGPLAAGLVTGFIAERQRVATINNAVVEQEAGTKILIDRVQGRAKQVTCLPFKRSFFDRFKPYPAAKINKMDLDTLQSFVIDLKKSQHMANLLLGRVVPAWMLLCAGGAFAVSAAFAVPFTPLIIGTAAVCMGGTAAITLKTFDMEAHIQTDRRHAEVATKAALIEAALPPEEKGKRAQSLQEAFNDLVKKGIPNDVKVTLPRFGGGAYKL